MNLSADKIMRKKRILSVLLCIAVLLSLLHGVKAAAEPTEVYTSFTSGNSSHTGDGTKESPYNLFEDALAAVADGGTVYITGSSAFINDESDGQPLKITKNVTIASVPGAESYPELSLRKGGIVLGADVTFSNIVLGFANADHAVICANGYTLTLNNISCSSGTRVVHLSGGSLYDTGGSPSLSPSSGSHSRIIVSGSKTGLGNIYAGSINGSFSAPVDITLDSISGSKLGSIYSSGAKEGYYNGDNFLDPNNEPEAPAANSADYPVTGSVSIGLSDSYIRSVDGETGGAANASLSVSSEYCYQSDLNNIHSLTVRSGIFEPTGLNSDADVWVQSGGTLDLSELSAPAVRNFTGEGGTLMLSRYGCLTVSGLFSGTADFKTINGVGSSSGVAEYDHLYINTASASGDGVFTFENPYPTQTEMTLAKTADGWRTSAKPEVSNTVTLTDFDISPAVLTASYEQINGLDSDTPYLSVIAGYTEDSDYQDISMVPLEYSVTFGSVTAGPVQSTELTEYPGCFEGNIFDFNINFTPIGDVITISNLSEENGNLGLIAAGVYDIVITAPTETGSVSRTVRLTVTGDSPASATPTAMPTAAPTALPTATPTTAPTATPTAVPTATPTVTPTATPGQKEGIYYEQDPELNRNTVSYKAVNNTSDKKAIFAVAVYDDSGEILKDIKLIIISPGESAAEPLTLNIDPGDKWRAFLWDEQYKPMTV